MTVKFGVWDASGFVVLPHCALEREDGDELVRVRAATAVAAPVAAVRAPPQRGTTSCSCVGKSDTDTHRHTHRYQKKISKGGQRPSQKKYVF